MSGPATRLTAVEIAGPGGRLEGLVQERAKGAHDLAALVCHPHPLHEGTMNNKVVHRVAGTLHRLGAAVLRFNFRGVGRSQGTFDDGRGELDDARAALAYLRARHRGARLWLAGFSFGSWIAARLAAGEAAVERLILVSPPVARSDFGVLRSSTVPKIVFQGTADAVCPPADLEAAYPAWAEPKRLVRIEAATHFYDKRLSALGHAMVEALAEPAGKGGSRDA